MTYGQSELQRSSAPKKRDKYSKKERERERETEGNRDTERRSKILL